MKWLTNTLINKLRDIFWTLYALHKNIKRGISGTHVDHTFPDKSSKIDGKIKVKTIEKNK